MGRCTTECEVTDICACKQTDPATILVVDDDETICFLIKRLLSERGHAVLTAGSIREALDTIHGIHIELVLLDENLPDGRGSTFLMDTQGQSRVDVPVMMMTGDTRQGLAVECLKAGAVDFVVKPFRPELLPTLVDRVLETVRLERERDEIRVRAEAAETANQMKSEFLSLISHEFRTPLTSVFALEQLIGDSELLVESGEEMIQRAVVAAERMEHMTDRALKIAQIRDKRLQPTLTRINLREVFDVVGAEFEGATKEKELTFSVKIENDTLLVDADFDWLAEAMEVLLSNAVRFTERGSISISLLDRGNLAIIEVADTGCGIELDRLNAIFGLFTQADMSNTRHYGGTGLGLTLAKELVEAMAGALHVSSDVGHGSRFTISLPKAAQ